MIDLIAITLIMHIIQVGWSVITIIYQKNELFTDEEDNFFKNKIEFWYWLTIPIIPPVRHWILLIKNRLKYLD